MSDATSIGSVLNQRVNANKSREPDTPDLKIVKIPKDIKRSDHQQRVSGKVIQKDDDGAINIRTNKGDITLKTEKRINVKEGDIVEVKITSGNTNASIAVIQKQINKTTQNTASHYTNIQTKDGLHIGAPIQELVNGAPIEVEAFPTNLLPTLTNMNNETLIYSAASLSNAQLKIKDAFASDTQVNVLLNDITKINIQSLPETLLAQPLENKQASLAFSSALLQSPITEVPLYFIAAKTTSNLQPSPIRTSISSPNNTVPPVLSEVKITDTNPPLTKILSSSLSKDSTKFIESIENIFSNTSEKAGNTHATLVGFTENKHLPVIRMTAPQSRSDQHYVLQTPITDILLGTQIELDITQTKPPNISTQSQLILQGTMPINVNSAPFLTPEIWQAMQEAHFALIQTNPQAAKAFSNIIPNAATPAQIQTTALFFIAALRSGDLQSWMGEKTIETLKSAGKGDVVNRLNSEISNLSRFITEPSPQEWRTLSLPMAWQNDIHKLILHYRKESNGSADNDELNNGTKTRFVMNVNLSQIGKVQLDGLFIGNPEGIGRMDLILRTEQKFSQSMRQEMRISYKNALDATNFTGELSFQGQIDGWVNITPEIESEFIEDV